MNKVVMNPVKRERRGPLNNRELADDLCADSPTLRDLRRVHVQSFGTLIPHVFMGNVLEHVGHCLLKSLGGNPANSTAEVGAILTTLEGGMTTGRRQTRHVPPPSPRPAPGPPPPPPPPAPPPPPPPGGAAPPPGGGTATPSERRAANTGWC